MTPHPSRCPFCGLPSACVDWQEVDNGVGVQQFEHEYECPAHGAFRFTREGVALWRDGDPHELVMQSKMSPRGHCMGVIGAANGDLVFCSCKYGHKGDHQNGARRWRGDDPYELLDRAFAEVLAWL